MSGPSGAIWRLVAAGVASGKAGQQPVRMLLAALCVLALASSCTRSESSAPVLEGDPVAIATEQAAAPPQEAPRTNSDHASLRGVELAIDSWEHTGQDVRVRVRIENRGPGIGLSPVPPSTGTVLQDTSGDTHRAQDAGGVSLDGLATEGLRPGESLAAVLVFPEPRVEPPWTLVVPLFRPLELPATPHPSSDPRAEAEPEAISASPRIAEATGPASGTSSNDLGEEFRDLLAHQAGALLRKDEGDYLETLHPHSRNAERLYFQHARQVPFSEVRLELLDDPPPEPSGSGFEAAVVMTVRLEEQPVDNPFVYRLTYQLVDFEDKWLVSSIREEPRRPIFWRQPSLALHRTHHFMLFVWPRPARDVLDVARDAEASYMAILQQGLTLAPRYLAHLVTDAFLFQHIVGSPLAVGAAVSRQVVESGQTRVDSRSFFLNGPLLAPFRIDRPDQNERRVTIAHELVHLALSPWTRPRTPPWLAEGAAVYYSGRLDFDSNRILVRSGLEGISLTGLTTANALGEHAAPDRRARAAFEYLYAGNLVAHLVRQFGNDRFLAFYRSFATVDPGDDLADDDRGEATALDLTETRLAEHFHLSLATLDRQVKESMRLRFR